MTTSPALTVEAVDARRGEALGRLTASTGDASLCAISRSGRPAPAAKYHEGAVAALTDVRRRLAEPHEPADAAVDHVRERWAARRDDATASSSSWQAYLNGALDALDDLTSGVGTGPSRDGLTDAGRLFADGPVITDLGPESAQSAPGNDATAGWRPRLPWTRRRTVAAVVLTPLLLFLLVVEGGGWAPQHAPLWTALVAVTAGGAAAILATYLPGQGACRARGLTPCAVVPLVALLAAGWLLGAEPHAVPSAIAALGVVAFGLVQRLSGTRCAA